MIAFGNRSVAIDIAAKPRYASAANEFGSAITAKSSPSAGMIDSTGAENVSAASSGSRIVRSARSTRSAAPSANSSPPKSPPSAGSVVARDVETRAAGVCEITVANTFGWMLIGCGAEPPPRRSRRAYPGVGPARSRG